MKRLGAEKVSVTKKDGTGGLTRPKTFSNIPLASDGNGRDKAKAIEGCAPRIGGSWHESESAVACVRELGCVRKS